MELSISPMRKTWESWMCSAWRREGVGELINVLYADIFYLKRGCKEGGAGFFSVVPKGTRHNGHKLKHRRFLPNIRRRTYCEGDQAVAQVTRRGCGVSICSDIQKLSRHSHEQLNLGGTAWAGALDNMTFSSPFQPWPFCDTSSVPVFLCPIYALN